MPFDLITNSTVHELMQRLQQHMDVARSRMEHAQHNQAHYANQRRRDSSFEEGEMVWLSTQNLKLPADTTRKLSTRYTGPFKILEAIGPKSIISWTYLRNGSKRECTLSSTSTC